MQGNVNEYELSNMPSSTYCFLVIQSQKYFFPDAYESEISFRVEVDDTPFVVGIFVLKFFICREIDEEF